MGDGGKGSQQRPTDKKKFDENYDRIFGKTKEKKEMITDRILCENLEEYKKDPEFIKLINIIDSAFRQGVFDLGQGYCSTTSLVLQSILHLNKIETEIIEVASVIEHSDGYKWFLGFDHVEHDNQVSSHVVLVTKTETPYLIDLSIGHLLQGEIGVVSRLNMNLHINTDILAEYKFVNYKILYRQKITYKFSQVYETSIMNRINTDKKIFNNIQTLKYLNYIAIVLSLFGVINYFTRLFL